MVAELQTKPWEGEAADVPCWWGGTVRVKPGDELMYYESPTVVFVHGIAGADVVVPEMTRRADG